MLWNKNKKAFLINKRHSCSVSALLTIIGKQNITHVHLNTLVCKIITFVMLNHIVSINHVCIKQTFI